MRFVCCRGVNKKLFPDRIMLVGEKYYLCMIKITSSYINILGKEIPYYGVFFLVGFAVSALVALFNSKKTKLEKTEVVYSAVFAGIGGIIGAKLLSVLTSLKIIIDYKLNLVQILQNGFVFYGGLIGGAAGLFIYCKVYKLSFAKYSDTFAPTIPIGHALGRIGCLMSGCCYGVPYNGFFSVVYLKSANANTPLNVSLFAVQLVEAILLCVLFLICEIVLFRSEKRFSATVFYLYAYSTTRFVLEFFRGDDIRGVAILSTSQYISLVILAVITFLLVFKHYKKKKDT